MQFPPNMLLLRSLASVFFLLCGIVSFAQQDFLITVTGDEMRGGISLPENWSEFVYFGEQAGDTTNRVTPAAVQIFIHNGKRYESRQLEVASEGGMVKKPLFVQIATWDAAQLLAGSGDRVWVSGNGSTKLIEANKKGDLDKASEEFLTELFSDCASIQTFLTSTRATVISLSALLDQYTACNKNVEAAEQMPKEEEKEKKQPKIIGKTFDDLGEWWFGAHFGVQRAQFDLESSVLERHNISLSDGASPTFGIQAMHRLKYGDKNWLLRFAIAAQTFDFESTKTVIPQNAGEQEPIHTLNYNPVYINARLGIRFSGKSLVSKGYAEIGPSVNYLNSFVFLDRYVYRSQFDEEQVLEFNITPEAVNDLQIGGYFKAGVMLNRVEAFAVGQYYPDLFDYADVNESLWMAGIGLGYWIF